MKVKSVQEITLTMTGTSSASASITPVTNLAKSIVVGTWKMSSVTAVIPAEDVTCDLWLSAAGTVNIQRDGTQGTITATVYIIEFGTDVVVQKGTFSMLAAGTTDSASLTAINLTDSFSGAFYRHGIESGSPSNDSDPETRLVSNKLTSTTNLAFTRDIGRGTINGHWFVVEDVGNTVTQETFVKNVSGTMTQALGASRNVVLADTFLISSMMSVEAIYNDEAVCNIKLSNTTTLEAQDGYGTTEADTIETNVVENANIAVQHFSLGTGDDGTSGTVAITAVDLTRAIIIPTIFSVGSVDTGYINGNLDERFVEFHFNSSTQIGWSRGATAQHNIYSFQVIEFEADSVPSINLVVQDSSHSHLVDNNILSVNNPPNITDVVDAPLDYDQDSLVEGSDFGSPIGTTKVYLSDASTLAGSINEVEVTSLVTGWQDGEFALNLSTAAGQLKIDLDNLGPGDRYIIIDKDGIEGFLGFFIYRAKAFDLKASANIAVSGENTTAQLTPPLGKTTGDFGGGKIQDDENPSDTIDLALNEYGEWEYSIEANTEAVDAETYEFRVLIGSNPANTISVTPEWLIGDASIELIIQDSLHSHSVENLTITQKYTLVIANTLHSHIVDNTVITQKYTLIVTDSLHGHTVDNIDLVEAEVLTVQSSLHSHITNNIVLTQKHIIVIANTVHAHITENTVLTQKNTLIVQDSLHSHTVENIIITSSINLIVQDTLHSHIAESIDIIQKYNLIVQETIHNHIVDNVVITQKHILVIQDTLHSHNAENLDIVAKSILIVEDTIHNHISSNVTLLEGNVLEIQSSIHSHTVESVILTQANILAIDDTVHSHIADVINLLQSNILSINDTIHTHTIENISLGISLIVQNTIHSHSVENIGLIQSYILTVQDSIHAHVSEVLTLLQSNLLIVQDTLHALTSDNIILEVGNQLVVQDSVHSHIVNNIELTQKNILEVQDSLHEHNIDNINLSQGFILTVDNGLHSHIVANVGLTQKQILEVQDTLHAHNSEILTLIVDGLLEVQNSLHNHTAENINLIQDYTLEVQETIHNHIVDNLIVVMGVTLTNINSTVHGHTVDTLTIIILKFITMIGKFKTGAIVTVDIYNLLDNSLVINADSMAEILTTGYFKYKLTGITTPNQEFLYIMTDGTSQQSGKLIFRENLVGELEAYSVDDVWTEEEKQEVLAYSEKASNNAEQINNKF